MVMQNRIFKARTKGVGAYTRDEAIEWGVTGPGLRACGFDWDFRKKRPYSGYEKFEFDIPTGGRAATATPRAQVRVEEMWQSLRIIEQCVEQHAGGALQGRASADDPAAEGAHDARHRDPDHHFLSVSWGPVLPAGEAAVDDRGDQGRQRLLPDQRPRHQPVPQPHPHAQLPAHADAAAHHPRLG